MSDEPINKQTVSGPECQEMLNNFVSQRGDKGAALLATLSRYIKYCSYKIHPLSPEDQQEILQEVGIKLLNQGAQVRSNCSGWLFTVVRNEMIDQLRKQNSRPKLMEPDNNGDLIEVPRQHLAEIPHHKNMFDETECLEHVFDHIESQPTGEMDILIYTQSAMGTSNGEIATQTGRSIGAIAKRLSLLRQRVKALRESLC